MNGDKFRIGTLLAQIFISTFSGALVVLFASFFSWDFELARGVAGLVGWSGATLSKVLEERLIKKSQRKGLNHDYKQEWIRFN